MSLSPKTRSGYLAPSVILAVGAISRFFYAGLVFQISSISVAALVFLLLISLAPAMSEGPISPLEAVFVVFLCATIVCGIMGLYAWRDLDHKASEQARGSLI